MGRRAWMPAQPRFSASPLGGASTRAEKNAVQHERAGQREYAHAKSKTVVKVVVDQHGADRGEQHDGQRYQEGDNPLHGPHPVACIQRQARCNLLSGLLSTRASGCVGAGN